MAKLYFYYSAMNAGKSTLLLQSAYNYKEKGMDTIKFTPKVDTRFTAGKIASRIGLSQDAIPFDPDFDFFTYTQSQLTHLPQLACLLIDEAQFLTKKQVKQLVSIVDELNLPVLTYGLRSDFRGEAFEGSLYLLMWADQLIEIKTICHCGKKASMNLRIDANGKPITQGSQIFIGNHESYVSLCRKHFFSALLN